MCRFESVEIFITTKVILFKKGVLMVVFEISVIIAAILLLLFGFKNKTLLLRFGLSFVGVLIFEYFTQALWLNKNLESWTYLYLDVSWVITLGWAILVTLSLNIGDVLGRKSKEWQRFTISLAVVSLAGIFGEFIVRLLGIREYASAVYEILSGYTILKYIPLEALYYIPFFMTLIISFVRYWEIILQKVPETKKKKKKGDKK